MSPRTERQSDVSSSAKGPRDLSAERHSNDDIEYLLSAGRLGGEQRERVFAGVMESVLRQEDRPRARWGSARRWIGAGSAAALAAVALLVVWARGSFDHGRFDSKGDKATSLLSIDAECLRATLAACPRKSVLAFSVRGASAGMFVTATLEPAEPGMSGPRVWLLSNEPASAQAGGAVGVLARGARVPEQQAAGTYHLEVVVTKRPVARDAAAGNRWGGDLAGHARFEITVPP